MKGVAEDWSDGAAGSSVLSRPSSGRWLQEHQRPIDVAVVAVVLFYDLTFLVAMLVAGGWMVPVFIGALALSVFMCSGFVLRHRRPLAASLGVLVGAIGQVVLGIGLAPAAVILLGLMLYTLGTRFRWTVVVPSVVAAAVWAGVAAVPVVEDERARVGEIGMLMLAYVVAALIGVLTRQRRARFDALQELALQLARERDAQAVIAATEERSRIAREIHDIVSHSLGTMVVMADGAAQTAEVDPAQAGQAMGRVRDTGRGAMGEMRRMLGVLRDDNPALRAPQPGLAQLEHLVAETRITGLRVDLTVTGVPVELSSGADLAAYRIVQEALTNARKHGGPLLSVVRVTVSYLDDAIDLRVVDDGRDDGAVTRPDDTGHGLVGMRERVSAYGGLLEAGPRSGGGFDVHVVLPVRGRK